MHELAPSEIDRTFGGQMDILTSHRYVIILVCIAAVVTSLYFSQTIQPRYEAEVIFYVPAASTQTSNSENEIPSFPVPSGDRDGASAAVSILRTAEARRRVSLEVPAKSIASLERDVDATVERSSLVIVYVRDRDPKVAADVANAYFKVFNQFVGGIEEGRTRTSLRRTEERLREVRGELVAATSARRDEFESLNRMRDKLERAQQVLERRLLQADEPAILASPATPPVSPVFPIPVLNAIVAAIAGLIAGALYASVLDYYSRRRTLRRWNVIQRQEWYTRVLAAPEKPGGGADQYQRPARDSVQ